MLTPLYAQGLEQKWLVPRFVFSLEREITAEGCADNRGGVISMRRIILLVVTAALMTGMLLVTSPLPAMAQPTCTHDFCDWYQDCVWEYWAWDAGVGWTLLSTDGAC